MAPLKTFWSRAHAPVDGAALAVFRILFGVLACVMPIRFAMAGWVERFYLEPTYFFRYWGFEWVPVPPAAWMHAIFVAMAIAGALVALGLFYRVAAAAFFVLFTWVELIDSSNYLNHHYLVSLLALLMVFLPLHRVWSVDAWRDARVRGDGTVPAWVGWLLRFQIGTVYLFAALAKLSADWLLHAQPLSLWLGARMHTPIVGAYFDRIEVAYAMSWAGFLYDLTIPFWLSWRRSRPFAFAVLLAFHGMTHVLFDIGMFPFIMSVAAFVFFEPSWPRRWVKRGAAPAAAMRAAGWRWTWARTLGVVAIAVWVVVQVALPLRAHVYGGNVLWDEQGMRWSWRVLCREKTGAVTFRVHADGWTRERLVPPRRYLTLDQEIEMAGQPDMILQLAHHIRDVHVARGERNVQVRVDARASLNGRRSAVLIDPNVDLARVEDSVMPARWIAPEPAGEPARVGVAGAWASAR